MTLEEFLLGAPLYSEIEVSRRCAGSLLRLGAVRLRGPCTQCGAETVYLNEGVDSVRALISEKTEISDGGRLIVFRCQKDEAHKLDIALRFELFQRGQVNHPDDFRAGIVKTGQFPSIVDLAKNRHKKLRGEIDDLDLRELNRASGLASHGVNVGAFIYLRRIFEREIYRTAAEHEIDSEVFRKMRMSEKIEYLKDHLPDIVVEESRIYPSLSSGLHQWTEEECSVFFEVLEQSVLLMLEERVAKRELGKRRKNIREKLKTVPTTVERS